jgi:dipeptidyl aminopeptidase/acylaminoacyl peptidase
MMPVELAADLGLCMRTIWIGGTLALLMASSALAAPPRVLSPSDFFQERTVDEPALSPDGAWAAYSVKTLDPVADKAVTNLWMTSWDGTRTVQLTSTPKESEHTPRWSPDGRYLAFLSGRGDENEADQLWLLDRSGGEAIKLTNGKLSVDDYAWSPDGRSLALILKDPEPQDKPDPDSDDGKSGKAATADKPDPKRPKPVVIDRFQFKADMEGYLGARRSRLYVMGLTDKAPARVTTGGDFEEALPAWSPDGKSIAFVSKRSADADRDYNWDIYVVDAKAGAKPRAVTTFEGSDDEPEWESYPAWSPDGKSIAYLQGGPVKLISYGVRHLAVIPAAGGTPRLIAPTLDRNVSKPRFSADGKTIRFVIEDDGVETLAEASAAGGPAKPLIEGRHVTSAYDVDAKGQTLALVSSPTAPAELFAVEKGRLRVLTHQNDWLKTVSLASVEEIKFPSADGTEVHGFLIKPPGYQAGRKHPTLLRLHGGPQSQYDLSWNREWQMLAAHGYVVVASNPRGSTGRGEAYASAIYADWGTLPVQDVLASVDYAVKQGVADPARLGVGGWSYGGILTNFVITADHRFKAAASGASISNVLAGYGTDQYIRDYEIELGKPWEHPETWAKISTPFLHADQIKTPTLFLGGDKDFNVPLLNSEQMYQALRSNGVETRLIIYPGQFHGLTRPSFLKDRIDRYLAWYDAHLGKPGG